MKRSLIVGASGQIGSHLLSVLGREDAIPTSRSAEASGWISFDLASIGRRAIAYCRGGASVGFRAGPQRSICRRRPINDIRRCI
jgi:uncharacterized protein YbjT (DUF2867 family)